MAIIGHSPKSGANSSNATNNNRELTAELWVESDDPEDTGHAVLTYLIANGFTYGAAYNVGNDDLTSRDPINTALYQIDAPVLAPGSSTMWSVMLHYRLVTREFQTGGGELAQNPFTRRPIMSIQSVVRSKGERFGIYRGGFKDSLGWEKDKRRYITNSAGKEMEPSLEIDQENFVLRITRNFPMIHVSKITFPGFWVNSTPLVLYDGLLRVTIDKYEMRSLGWSLSPRYEEGFDFIEATFEGEITREENGWRHDPVDVGFEELAIDPKYLSSHQWGTDAEGRKSVTPKFLDGAGKFLADQLDESKYVYSLWSVIPEVDIRSTPFFAGLVQ